MIEIAVVIDADHRPLHWHAPTGASRVALPDSRALWEVLWRERDRLGGVAHSHPGAGEPRPSVEDLTTFSACEAGLGRRLGWWIATSDAVRRFDWVGPTRYDYRGTEAPIEQTIGWLDELRLRSDRRIP